MRGSTTNEGRYYVCLLSFIKRQQIPINNRASSTSIVPTVFVMFNVAAQCILAAIILDTHLKAFADLTGPFISI